MTLQEIFDSLGQAFGEKLQHRTEFRGETTYALAASDLREIAKFCRDEISFDYLLDITSIDNFGEEPRFEIVYHLYSITQKHGPVIIRMRTADRAAEARLPSLTPIWRSAEFQEREIFDLYGIRFDGHPDMRRILMWDEFKDYPMRKDYREPDDYEYEPTPHDDVLEKAKQHYAPRPQFDGAENITAQK